MDDFYNAVIDYRQYIAEQARDFYGREALFVALDTWLATGQARFFAIIGPPGSGKTAISARLAQFAMASIPVPATTPLLGPAFLSAIHFCPASDLRWMSDRRWFQPKVFAESLSRQLAARYPGFAQALIEQAAQGRIIINTSQQVDQNNGTLIGVHIERLDLGGLSAEDAFSYAVREPLEALLKHEPGLQIVVLVDALDEAQRYNGRPTIVSLLTQTGSLSPQVRFIVTARPGVTELELLATQAPQTVSFQYLDEEPYRSESLADVHAFFLGQAHTLQLEQRLQGVTLAQFAQRVSERSQGNFLYVTQLSHMLHSYQAIGSDICDTLPIGLTAFYRAFLAQAIEQSQLNWEQRLQPALGSVAVAQEAIRRKPLAGIVAQPEAALIPVLKSVRPLLDLDDQLAETQRTYSFYHRSFADFLLDADDAGEYWCEAAEQHERMIRYYQQRLENTSDLYGRRYLGLHLAEAALAREQPERHMHTAALVELICSDAYQLLRIEHDGCIAFRDDLERTLRTAAHNNHPAAPRLLMTIAATMAAFRATYLTPEAVFQHAQAGRLAEAARWLALFPIEAKWQHSALLAITWVALSTDAAGQAANPTLRADAEAILKQVEENPFLAQPLPRLYDLVAGLRYQTPIPAAMPLPPAPEWYIARDIVARIGGAGMERLNVAERIGEYVSSALTPNYEAILAAMGTQQPSQSIFVAAQDGPLLVAYAIQRAADPQPMRPDEHYIDHYIALQAANGYVRYRNGSLWALLDAILRHPDPAWVRSRVVQLVSGALAGSRLEFQQAVPLTLQALAVQAGDAAAQQQLAGTFAQVDHAISAFEADHGRNDTIGEYTRRLATLAQLHATLLAKPNEALAMLDRALNPHMYGYAGLYAPAALTLAEALRICQPNDLMRIQAALAKARRSAHRIQDAPFCAQTTARYNALAQRWWAQPLNPGMLEQSVYDFAANPGDQRFTALHLRAESYPERPQDDPDQLPVADWVVHARSLPELAEVYERPLAEFERVNPTDDGLQPEVNVPDPAFTPLLAAYFSAELLVAVPMPAARKVELIQLLVPLAASSPTALDTVLGRLLIATAQAGWMQQAEWQTLQWVEYTTAALDSDMRVIVNQAGEHLVP